MPDVEINIRGSASGAGGFAQAAAAAESAARRADTAIEGLGRASARAQPSLRGSSAAMTEFGRVIQDLPYGIQGVANNVQQLAFVMGAGGPLMLAISVVTGALVIFSGEISAHLNKTKEQQRAYESLAASMVKIVELQQGVTLTTSATNARARLSQIAAEQARYQDIISRVPLAGGFSVAPGAGALTSGGISRAAIANAREELAVLLSLEQQITDELTEHERRERMINAGRRVGLTVTREELETEKEVGRTQEANNEREIAAYWRRIELQNRLNTARAKQARNVRGYGVEGPAPAGGIMTPGADLQDRMSFEALEAELNQLDIATVAISASIQNNLLDLGPVIQQGMADAVIALASGTASFREVLASFLGDLGKAMIAQGFAGIALKAFVLTLSLAIAAGAALVAISSELSKKAQAGADGLPGGLGGTFYGGGYGAIGGHAYTPGAYQPQRTGSVNDRPVVGTLRWDAANYQIHTRDMELRNARVGG